MSEQSMTPAAEPGSWLGAGHPSRRGSIARCLLGSLGGSALAAALAISPALAAPPGGLPPGQAKKMARFHGHHPIAGPAGGFCYIEAPHSHDYVPDRPALYQEANGDYVFTGDPVPFGYQGDKTVFYGHHPVPVESAPSPHPVFCFLKGPHYHDYHAPEAPGYKVKDNVAFYVGPLPPEIARNRPQQERALEVEYRPYVAQRPQVVVTPPPEWQGTVWVAPPPSTVVVAPPPAVVPVVAPAPSTVVVAPARPPTVIVAPPQPAVIIAPMGPPGVIVMPGYGHPGKHKGWYKHGRW